MQRLVMATDLSVRSDRALQRAFVLAHDLGLRLSIVHVVDDSLPENVVERQELAAKEAINAHLAALETASATPHDVQILRGQDFAELVSVGNRTEADLLVLGDHRHTLIDMFRGTTVERVVRYGDLPVLVVKSIVIAPYRKVLVAVDTSAHSKAALRLAARLAPHSEMQLLHACQESFPAFLDSADRKVLVREQQEQVQDRLRADVQALSAELGSKSPKFEFVFDVGDPLSVIRQYCLENKPELIALGTHGRSGLAHAVVGSIAENLLADSDVDVLAVKAPSEC